VDVLRIVIIDAAIIIIIIYLVFTNFLIGSQVCFLVLDNYYFIFLISRLRYIGIIKLRPRSVSIMLLLQIQSDDLMRSVGGRLLVGVLRHPPTTFPLPSVLTQAMYRQTTRNSHRE